MSNLQPISSLLDLVIADKNVDDIFTVSDYNTLMRAFEDKTNRMINALKDRESNWAGSSAPTDNTVQGKLWMDTRTDRLKLDPDGSGADQPLARTLTVDITAVSLAADVAGDLIAYTIPADTLKADGKILRITAWGTKTGTNGVAQTQLLIAGTAVSLGAFNIPANSLNWIVEVLFIRTGLSAQAWSAQSNASVIAGWNGASAVTEGVFEVGLGTTTEDDTSTITISVGCRGTGNASDTIVEKGLLIELLN